MPSHPLALPWSGTLEASTTDLDRGGRAIIRSHDINRRQWATALHRGLRGDSFAAAQETEDRITALRVDTVELIETAVSVLSRVAFLQSALEDEYDRVIETARSSGLQKVAGVVIALTDERLEEAEVFNLMLGWIRREGILLDRHCAARLELLLPALPLDERRNRCEATLEELYTPAHARFPLPADPAVSATQLHEMNMIDADDRLRDLTDRYPGMIVLETGDRHLVAAFGDIDSADSVVTMVSGVGSGTPESVTGTLDRGRTLHREIGGAVIVWNGYRSPETVIDGGQDIAARLGAVKLQTFMDALTERRGLSVHRTVLAHSYGSLVTGLAAAERNGGLDADAVVFLGSPGAGVAGVDELRLNSPDPRILAARSATDPISLVNSGTAGLHGRDPASAAFGAEVIPANGGHNDYFDSPAVLEALRRVRSR
ncbi:alpha/beta hydrolase [Corynebacterium meridianum]|uniref:DUF1023 domain-containing protein n=1 Tax=Corynebacterium meridianum TaxID=2765363 RepID=A0A934M5K7_9CORY|nr:hypothetical protein [Corynebacterium meridianum]MCK7678398.1 alpha/beta hydrolase family protein [Corynebacterium meridianum]